MRSPAFSVSEFLDSFRCREFHYIRLAVFIRKAHSSIFIAVKLFALARQIVEWRVRLCVRLRFDIPRPDSRYKAPSSMSAGTTLLEHLWRRARNYSFTMSHSPERLSSYRRHFEGGLTSSTLQVRVSSPSPTRGAARHRSASYTRRGTMGRRARSGSRKSRMTSSVSMGTLCLGMGLGVAGGALDLDAAAAENQAFLSTRTSERKEMVTLNDRLAVYIEKVRSLEQSNKLLETEIEGIKSHHVKPSGLRLLYEDQLRELRRIADQMKVQRDLAVAAKDAMAGQLEMLKVKYEEALEARKKAELEIETFRPDVDAATSARIALEKRLENLEVELEFLQRIHKKEIEELMAQIYGSVAKVDVAFSLPDLASALKQIQAQYDSIAAQNLQEMDAWYKAKFQDLNKATSRHVDTVRSIREELTAYKREIQNKQRELDALKNRNEALLLQIQEAQERHKKEEEGLQIRIETLKEELKSIKGKIGLLLREYQELLNIKMSLEIEITTYRKLIEGEDSRLSSMVSGLSLMSVSAGRVSSVSGAISEAVSSAASEKMLSSSTIVDHNHHESVEEFTHEQAVEMTERKTVLIS
ncbi:glial fibrillary acidic protein isoform X2 [Carassius gibelio]|uniref:glial fibrillary acidic protein isoform X2 n=1 Tax=Carassius gibelio TaxID=101364 RepID=UPI00227826BB|nr:glial fibrillary acidic protein isoform X2 [Carassius gibelio]